MTVRRFHTILLSLALFPWQGCIAFYTSHPARVTVLDAETGASLPGVRVALGYHFGTLGCLNPPDESPTVTDVNGLAILRAANLRHWKWFAFRDGYIPWEEREPAGTYPHDVILHLYREPTPRVRIIVPRNYRGPVMIHYRKSSAFIQDSPGKRNFEYRCSADGYVAINATQLLWQRFDYEICDESGMAIKVNQPFYPDTIKAWNIGRPLFEKPDELKLLWVIGTATDESTIKYRVMRPNGEPNTEYQDAAATDALFTELAHSAAHSPNAR